MTPRRDEVGDRAGRIGSSDVPVILGLAPESWGVGPLDRWEVITGRRPADQLADDVVVQAGVHLEPLALRLTAATLGVNLPAEAPYWTHPEYPWASAHPDAVVRIGGRLAIIEAKTSSSWRRLAPIHSHVVAQIEWQWWVGVMAGAELGRTIYLAVIHLGQGPPVHETYAHEVDLDRAMQRADQIIAWWHRHVDGDTPPPVHPTDSGAALARSTGALAKARPALEREAEMIRLALVWRQRESYAAAQAKLLTAALAETARQAGVAGFVSEHGRYAYVRTKGRSSTAWEAVCREAGVPAELVARHTRVGEEYMSGRLTAPRPPRCGANEEDTSDE